jgi:hypothetical protein
MTAKQSSSGEVRLRPGALEWRAVEGEVLAVDIQASQYVVINRSGAVLWPALVEGATAAALEELLVQALGIDKAAAKKDVASFLLTLHSRGLLE